MKHVVLHGLMVIVMMISASIAHSLDLKDKDLLLYYSASNIKGGIVTDESPNGNDGVIVGKVESVDGKYGKGLGFAEQGEVQAPHIALDKRSFTVSMWVYPELSGGAEQVVFSQTQVNAQNTSLHYRIYTNATIRMGFYANDLDAPGSAKAKEWQHVTFWLDVDKKTRRIYVNGEQVAEDQGKAGIDYLGTAGDTMIGSWGATGQKFNGIIDEVQVWNRALSEKEIQESMEDLSTLSVDAKGKLATAWGAVKAQ